MKGLADSITVNVDTLWEAFLNTSLSCACFIDWSSFLVKSKTSGFGTTVVKCRFSSVSKLLNNELKGICCTLSGRTSVL